jgi:hypothetical protein
MPLKVMLMQGEDCMDINSPNKRTVHIRNPRCFVPTQDSFQYSYILSSPTEVAWSVDYASAASLNPNMFIPTNNVHSVINFSNPKDEVQIRK